MILAANLFIAAAFLLGAALLIVDIRKKKHLYQKEDPLLKLIKEEPVLCYPETATEYQEDEGDIIAAALKAADHLEETMPVTCALVRMLAADYNTAPEPKNSKENHMFNTTREAVEHFVTNLATKLPGADRAFTAQQLERFVYDNIYPNVPSGANTILRALRELRILNKLDYVVLNRGKQLYKAVPVSYEGFGAPAIQD